MKKAPLKFTFKILGYLALAMMLQSAGCAGSERISGADDAMNGGFEVVEQNLPVNWYFYTMNKVRAESDFDISSDTSIFKEGSRSLKFSVRKCSNIGGTYSPGFFGAFNATVGETYKVSFWVKNEGCKFRVYLESSEYMVGSHSDTILSTKQNYEEWTYVEADFKVQYEGIRFEANILSPGTIWFDDVRIEGYTDRSPRKAF